MLVWSGGFPALSLLCTVNRCVLSIPTGKLINYSWKWATVEVPNPTDFLTQFCVCFYQGSLAWGQESKGLSKFRDTHTHTHREREREREREGGREVIHFLISHELLAEKNSCQPPNCLALSLLLDAPWEIPPGTFILSTRKGTDFFSLTETASKENAWTWDAFPWRGKRRRGCCSSYDK